MQPRITLELFSACFLLLFWSELICNTFGNVPLEVVFINYIEQKGFGMKYKDTILIDFL